MGRLPPLLRSLTGALLVGLALAAQAVGAPYTGDFPWREWSDQVFEQAAREKKFVLLSLQSWWCPWCHVMNRDTYDDPGVRKYLLEHFVPVRVDQDSRPDISQRYERWGWPATIIFGSDGTEIVKLRGFFSPQFFMPVLMETVKDPSPVDYGTPGGPERARRLARSLTEAQRAEIRAFIDQSYDAVNGGWGKSKLVDAPTLTWALDRAKEGDRAITPQIRKTMERLPELVHAGTGAVSQISLKPDWSAPAPEFPMFAQEAALKAFAQAYALWGDPRFRTAGAKVARFLTGTMAAPDGGFYASLGLGEGNPGVDRRQYARENGQAIAGLLAWYDATGDEAALRAALRATDWVLANRALPGGGFRHADKDAAGPYLADNVEMGKALLALHRSTGDRRWLSEARATADFIAGTFVDAGTGGFIAAASPDARHLAKPVKQREDNVTAVRFFNLLHFYTGEAKYREIAEAGMGYLASPPILDAYGFLPDVLQAEAEMLQEPVHLTVIGAKDDPRAAALVRAGLAYPLQHKRVEWWDKREGALPHHDMNYPDYPGGPAAFACTRSFCSLPVTDPAAVARQLDRLQRAVK
jgi:uncharacterized protein